MLAYGLQDATVPSRWDGFSRVGALEVQTKIAYVPQDATSGRSNRACAKQLSIALARINKKSPGKTIFLAYPKNLLYLCTRKLTLGCLRDISE